MAHNLTEKNYKVLFPCRLGSGGRDSQGNHKDLLKNPERFESISDILDLLREGDLEQELLNKVGRYIGKL